MLRKKLPVPGGTTLALALVSAPLSADQVVDNLVRKNLERAQALVRSEATRTYHLSYRGFRAIGVRNLAWSAIGGSREIPRPGRENAGASG